MNTATISKYTKYNRGATYEVPMVFLPLGAETEPYLSVAGRPGRSRGSSGCPKTTWASMDQSIINVGALASN